jgi:CRISPR/Cas system CMR subunit Cmr6 (Cas7 group RAMP superfamily)
MTDLLDTQISELRSQITQQQLFSDERLNEFEKKYDEIIQQQQESQALMMEQQMKKLNGMLEKVQIEHGQLTSKIGA